MKLIAASIVSLALCASLACAKSLPKQDPAESAKKLNAQSKATLGVSIESLSYLYMAYRGSVLLKAGISSWESVKALEKAGLITIYESNADGETYVQLVRTEKGDQVHAQLRGP